MFSLIELVARPFFIQYRRAETKSDVVLLNSPLLPMQQKFPRQYRPLVLFSLVTVNSGSQRRSAFPCLFIEYSGVSKHRRHLGTRELHFVCSTSRTSTFLYLECVAIGRRHEKISVIDFSPVYNFFPPGNPAKVRVG